MPARSPMRFSCRLMASGVNGPPRSVAKTEAGNAIIRSGKLGQVVQSILAEQKPEAAYFTAEGGQRGGIMVVNISDVSQYSRPRRTMVLDRQRQGGILLAARLQGSAIRGRVRALLAPRAEHPNTQARARGDVMFGCSDVYHWMGRAAKAVCLPDCGRTCP